MYLGALYLWALYLLTLQVPLALIALRKQETSTVPVQTLGLSSHLLTHCLLIHTLPVEVQSFRFHSATRRHSSTHLPVLPAPKPEQTTDPGMPVLGLSLPLPHNTLQHLLLYIYVEYAITYMI
ncbi:hypothetical protein F5B18DRAFT_327213 [Nemania serpens]|nr:hypothetical protein F5B18DRAFT_327213 [Nemania serpens]